MTGARAAIVIVNFNGAEFIEATIRSALAQTIACDVIVVDNGSSDASLAVLENISGIQLVVSPANLGFGGGANLGAAASVAPFIAVLNSDAIAEHDWLATMLPWMDAAGVSVASSAIGCGTGVWFGGGRWFPALGTSLMVRRPLLNSAWLSGCALVVRRDAWRQLDGFDPEFFLYFEDVDLSLRARALGLRIAAHPQTLVHHDSPGRSGIGMGFEKLRIAYRAKGRLIRKHVRGPAFSTAALFQCTISPLLAGLGPNRLRETAAAFWDGVASAGRAVR